MPEPTLTPATPPTTPRAAPGATAVGTEEDVTTSLYRAAIGPMNADFYLPLFARFEATERAGLSWNSAASLLTFNWLVYRQLWGAALAYVGILAAVGLLVFGIGRLVFQMSDTLTMALSLGFGLAAFVLPGLFGNALFQKECRKRMATALAAHAVLAEACLALQRQSSSRLRILWVALANAAVLGIVAFASIQISNLSTLAVLPQGALDAGHVATGLGAKTGGSLAHASAASTDLPIGSAASATSAISAASAPELAASAPMPVASAVVAAASQATGATTPMAAASTSLAAAAAPVVTISARAAKPEPIEVIQPSPPAPAKAELPAKAASIKAETTLGAKEVAKAEPAASNKPVKEAAVKKAPTKDVSSKSAPASQAMAAPEALFYINVGLFSKPQNAARVHAQLLEAKLPSVMKELKTVKERQIRVRVGPFASEQQAEVAAEKIRSMKFDVGIIKQ